MTLPNLNSKEIKLRRAKFDLMLCVNCRHISAYKASAIVDGHNCPVCHSPVIPLGRYRSDNSEVEKL